MQHNWSLCYVDAASMNFLKHAFDRCPNSISLMFLNNVYEEHCLKFDNRDPGGINNFSGALNLLLPNKHLTRSSKDWKSQLRNFKQPIEILAGEGAHCDNNCQKNAYSEGSGFSLLKSNSCNTLIKNVNNIDLTSFNTNESTNLLPDLSDGRSIIFKQKILPRNNSLANTSSNSNMLCSSQGQTTISKSQFNLNSQLSEANLSNNYENKCFSNETNESLFALNMQSKLQAKATMNCIMQNDKELDKAKNTIFRTAREQLISTNPAAKKSLGTTRKVQSKFVSPLMNSDVVKEETSVEADDNLKHIDPKMIELIQSEIIDHSTPIGWDDIAGLKMAKSVIQEAVVWPLLRPDIFTGLRRPPKGILLFGPPGTGKTLIGKCVASQCQATFFNISASSLTSKWIGDGEKMVRALFAVARSHQPAVIFIDEIDSLLTQRSDAEHEATRRIKTEFLVQFDGAGTGEDERLLIIGATNRPQELDEAARRRLVKRLYIPLPDAEARQQIIVNLLKNERNQLRDGDVEDISRLTEGYSGADMKSLCSEAAMGPIRSVPLSQMVSIQTDLVRPVVLEDFRKALERVRPSVSQDDLGQYVKWNKTYGLGY